MNAFKDLLRREWALRVREKWIDFIHRLRGTECATRVMDKWKALFRERWKTCHKCDDTIYYGELYGSAEAYDDGELSLTGKRRDVTLVFCESCTETGFYFRDGKQLPITKRGRVKK